MANVRTLLKPNGFVDILESTKVNRFAVFIFGVLDGYWRFEDFETRSSHCTISKNSWCDLLRDCGFKVVAKYPCVNDYFANIRAIKVDGESKNMAMPMVKMKRWIVFHVEGNPVSEYFVKSIPQIARGRNVFVVSQGEKFERKSANSFSLGQDFGEDDFNELMKMLSREDCPVEGIVYCWSLLESAIASQDTFLRPYFLLVKSLRHLTQAALPKLATITSGAVPFAENEISTFCTSTIWGFAKSLANENPGLNCKCIDIGATHTNDDGDMLQIFFELWSSEKTIQVAFKKQNRFLPKFISHKPFSRELKMLTGAGRFQLTLQENRTIETAKFDALPPEFLESNEIEIQVKACAPNFLNLMNSSEDVKSSEFGAGSEFSGVVARVGANVAKWSVGDAVFGLQWKYPVSSHIKMDENKVISVPENMTFCEASTLPLAFGTAYSCLIDIAKVKSSDTVLIHMASGGVGLSAIEVCKYFGANIIATVEGKREENYLRSLGIQHIFITHNTDYVDKILNVTNGRGVDVVLNSLTSPGSSEATLKTCSQGACFIDISKLSCLEPEDVNKLRPDVKYTFFDAQNIKSESWTRIFANLEELLKKGVVNPLPYVRFDGAAIRDAVTYLQQNAGHIGKIVCVMPDVKQVNGAPQVSTPVFHPNATYLITGGLGGIGFEVCKWMVDKGAKHVLLAGRKRPNSKISDAINSLNSKHSAKIQAVQLDVSSYEQCKQFFTASISEMDYPILRGVMHAAGTLNDALIENQTWDTLSSTFRSKVDGTLNLHEFTKNNSRLEHFVLFSSAVAQLGMPGQSNHAAGNQFQDSLAHYRHSMGLPATSVNWGQWGQVGVATEVTLPGIKPFSTAQAITALEYSLKSHRTQTSVVSVESFPTLSKRVLQLASYVDEKTWNSRSDTKLSPTSHLSSATFWQRFQSTDKKEEKIDVVKKALAALLAQILQLDTEEKLDDHSTFQEMGVDSLLLVQLSNSLQSLLGDKAHFSVEAVREFNTVKLLSEEIVLLVDGNETEVCLDRVPTSQALMDLIKEDCHLPEYIVGKPEQSKCAISQASCVMLTGSSGAFGPYILKELSGNPQITEIICVMRPSQKTTGMERLVKALAALDLHQSVDMNKVTCVDGNVALTQLGMKDNVWEELCSKVDAVFHFAAYVRHTERYKKHKSANNMRAVNVDGVKNVLHFASTGDKLKHVFFSSTLFAVTKLDKNGYYFEDWSDLDDLHHASSNGYLISKLVGEILMKQAVLERGIPGKVFRFPHLTGNSETGRFVLDSNHITQRFLFILKHKMITPDPFPIAMLPVDTCASASVKLFFDPTVPNDIYNVNNTTPHVDQEFIDIAEKLGHRLELVEYPKFIKMLKQSTVQDSPFAVFKDFYTNDFQETFRFMPWLQNWMLLDDNKKKEFMIGRKVRKFLPDFYENPRSATDNFYNDMLFAKSQNWLEVTSEEKQR